MPNKLKTLPVRPKDSVSRTSAAVCQTHGPVRAELDGGWSRLRVARESLNLRGWCGTVGGKAPLAVDLVVGHRRIACQLDNPDTAAKNAPRRFEVTFRTRKRLVWVRLEATFDCGPRLLGKPFLVWMRRTYFSPRRPPPPDPRERAYAAFVSEGMGSSYRYRCMHMADAFTTAGYTAKAYPGGELPWHDLLARHRLIVLHRTRPMPTFESWIRTAETLGIRVVFDIDDLLFDSPAVAEIPFLRSGYAHLQRNFETDAHRFAQVIQRCHELWVSTPTLAAEAARCFPGKTIRTLPNCADRRLVALSSAAFETRVQTPLERGIILGYFSGSPTHDRDFAVCADAVAEFLRNSPDSRLHVVGELAIPAVLQPVQDRIVHYPAVSWEQLPQLIATVDVNLVPLEADSIFNRCKSELKFFEAGLAGVPTLATATIPFTSCIRNGVNGILAASTDDWLQALQRLELDCVWRQQLGHQAREDAHTSHTTAALADTLPGLISGENVQRAAPPKALQYLFLRDNDPQGWEASAATLGVIIRQLLAEGFTVGVWQPEEDESHMTHLSASLPADILPLLTFYNDPCIPFAQVTVATCVGSVGMLGRHTLTWFKAALLPKGMHNHGIRVITLTEGDNGAANTATALRELAARVP